MPSKTLPLSTYRFGDLRVPCIRIDHELYHMPVTWRGTAPLGPFEFTDMCTQVNNPRIVHVSDDGSAPVFEGDDGEVAIVLPESWQGAKFLAGRSWDSLRWCTTLLDAFFALTDSGMVSVPIGEEVPVTRTNLLPEIEKFIQGRDDYNKLMGRAS